MTDETKRFASADDLGVDADYVETPLPSKGMWIRVRLLETPEISRLTFLPDLTGFAEMIAKLQLDPGDETVDSTDLAIENYRYEGYVVHLAVLANPADGDEPDLEPVPCDYCIDANGESLSHPPSLWSPRQAQRLGPQDLSKVSAIALGRGQLTEIVPFSEGPTPDGSREHVESSE